MSFLSTFNAIIFNENSSWYDTVRFSFSSTNWVKVSKVYIHTEVELVDSIGSTPRRRMLLTSTDDEFIYEYAR